MRLLVTQAAFELLAELMMHDDFNLASGISLLKRLHYERRELLTSTNSAPEGPLRSCSSLP